MTPTNSGGKKTANDDGRTTRRQVLAGSAGLVTVPGWAATNEQTAAAYDRNFNSDDGLHTQNVNFAGMYMRDDWWENTDITIQAYTGDEYTPKGQVGFEMQMGPFTPSLTFSTEEARELARKLRDAAQDAEVMTHAQIKDYETER